MKSCVDVPGLLTMTKSIFSERPQLCFGWDWFDFQKMCYLVTCSFDTTVNTNNFKIDQEEFLRQSIPTSRELQRKKVYFQVPFGVVEY